MGEITRFGAAELARRIRVGDASPLEVVDAHIAREDVEPHINALITTTFDAARSTARRLTDAGVPADPPPLDGVPITAAPEGGRGHRVGQVELLGHERLDGDGQPYQRPDAESVAPRPVRGRQLGQRGGDHCRRRRTAGAGSGHRGQHPRSVRVLRGRRVEADRGARLDGRARAPGAGGHDRLEHGRAAGAPGRGPWGPLRKAVGLQGNANTNRLLPRLGRSSGASAVKVPDVPE